MRVLRIAPALALAAIGGAWLGTSTGHATTMSTMNLAGLTTKSRQIVIGTVSAVNQGRMGSLPYQEVTVRVSETIRGSAQATIRFRQLDMAGPQAPENGRKYLGAIAGMPRYAVGERVLLFLGAPAANDFRTTIGLQQGKFNLNAGNAANEFGNRGLFRGLTTAGAPLSLKEQSMIATTQGVVDASTLVGLVRRAVAGRWWDPPPSKSGGRRSAPVVSSLQTEGVR